jgi:hypothetical protein
MPARDLHESLKTAILHRASIHEAEMVLARLAWGKDDVAFTLHVQPKSFSSYGLQLTDFLSYLGFRRQTCSFLPTQCYARKVTEALDIKAFGRVLSEGYEQLCQAQRHLEGCGFVLDQPEGWGFFFGKSSGGSSHRHGSYHGDGHTSATPPQRLEEAEDDAFRLVLTRIKGSDQQQGWTTHYQPKHPPLSPEVQSVFRFLHIQEFDSCPEFDFEPCYWRHTELRRRGDSVIDTNADAVHLSFEAHATRFSRGVEGLLAVQAAAESVGMTFLPSFPQPNTRRKQEMERQAEGTSSHLPEQFDVAISYSGTDRAVAEHLAKAVRDEGFTIFYDRFYPEQLWGKDLVQFFHEIYSKRARYCVILVSSDYRDKEWTTLERRSAQERMLREKGREYILPIRLEDVELPGILSTMGYVSISIGIDEISRILIRKLNSEQGTVT